MKLTSQEFLTKVQQDRISEAVKQAEATTAGEIVPVLATASDSYDRGLFLAAFAALGMATMLLFAFFLLPVDDYWPESWILPYAWEIPAYLLVPIQLVATLAGYYAALYFGGVHRAFIPRAVMQRRVDAAARQAFQSLQISQTRDATGILLYVSIFERMVVVVADKAINEKHDNATWDGIRDLLIEGLKSGKPDEGYVKAIQRCGEILTASFPIKPDDTNELPNHLRLV